MFTKQGTWVQTLVGDKRFHMMHGRAKKKEEEGKKKRMVAKRSNNKNQTRNENRKIG